MPLFPRRQAALTIVAVALLALPAMIPRGYMPHVDAQGDLTIGFCKQDMCPFGLASAAVDAHGELSAASDWGPVNLVGNVSAILPDFTLSRPPLPARGPPPPI